jgi:hypothetical protein
MSIIDGARSEEVIEFGGAKPLLDPIDLEIGEAVLAFNCEFFPKRIQPRRGLSSAWSPNQAVQSLKYWAQGQSGTSTQYISYLHDNTTISLRNIGASTTTDILTGLSGANLAVFAPWGARLYAALLNSTGFGNSQGYVWDGNIAHTMNPVFQRPMLTSEVTLALSQPGAGICTVGPHFVGVLFQTTSGYLTKPGPATSVSSTGVVLAPASITATGSGNIQATVTPATTWPTWIQAVQIIYTTTANSFQYYLVPGTLTTVTPGSATPATITWNIADIQLRAIGSQGAGTLADEYFDLLSMDSSNNPPFKPKFVISWGQRLVWFGNFGGIDSFFPSDPLNPETITGDQHILQLPGGLPIVTAFVLRGILYVLSNDGGMFAYYDNGGRPVTFSPPQEVEASIAVLAPLGVTTDDSGSGYSLIASQQGLFLFPGIAIPDIPLSYYAGPDWDQIDWTKPLLINTKIHQQDRLFLVKAVLQSGQVYVFTFNYLNGRTPEKIKYSPWTIGASYPLGALEIVLNPTKSVWELYVTPTTASASFPVLRQKSTKAADSTATQYQDLTSTGIDWRYQHTPLPDNPGDMLNHVAIRFRATSPTGSSTTLYITVSSLDGTRTVTPAGTPFTVATTPDAHSLVPYDFTNEQASYLFSNNVLANNAAAITYYQHFYTHMAQTR